jgi:hypothetical protein
MTTDTKIDLAQIRADERLLVSTIQQDYPELAQRGQRYSIPRGHDADSLSVYRVTAGRYAGEWRWTRFGTGESGSVIDWMIAYRGASDVSGALEMLGLGSGPRQAATPKTRRVNARPQPVEFFRWDRRPLDYLDEYTSPTWVLDWWKRYRPVVTDQIVKEHRLGVGRLPIWWAEDAKRWVPSGGCGHSRLIYPIWEREPTGPLDRGQPIGFRGRSFEPECLERCPKWLSAKGIPAVLYGIRKAPPGSSLIVCESPVDAMIANSTGRTNSYVVAPTAGAGTWRDEWTEQIVMTNPLGVIVWYDNDLAGTPNGETYKAELDAWFRRIAAKNVERVNKGQKSISPNLPEPGGPKLAKRLRDAGLKVSIYEWPPGTPAHADMGWALENWHWQADTQPT